MSRKRLISALKNGDVAALTELREASDSALSLDGETLTRIQITDMDLDGIDLSNTEWDECMLDRVVFGEANLEGAFFRASTLMACDLSGTNLDGAALDGCVLRRVVIAGANVTGTEITNSQFEECELRDLALDEVDWRALAINDGEIANISGTDGALVGVTLRNTKVGDFDTSGLSVERCSVVAVEGKTPEGFSERVGRRKKV